MTDVETDTQSGSKPDALEGTQGTTHPEHRGRVKVEEGHKRVRAYLEGYLVADTSHPLLVWERPMFPTYYFPEQDVLAELVPTGETEHSPSRGEAIVHDVVVPVDAPGSAISTPGAARRYSDSPIESLRHAVRIDWNAMSEWLEEDEPVYTHARDPYTRVDILHSSRHVVVQIDGVTVADSVRPTILFETGLPARYYLPLSDVRTDLLTPTDTVTHCPYKGAATYWSVSFGDQVHDDLVWTYRTPFPESQKIAGLACFYNEHVDISVDGEPIGRPHSPFS